jgi:hypothetical protein
MVVGAVVSATVVRATAVRGDVQVTPRWLACSDSGGALERVRYRLDDGLGGPGFQVPLAPRPAQQPTRCQLELAVANVGERPFSLDYLDLQGAGPGGDALWTVDPEDTKLFPVEIVGEDAHFLGDGALEPDESTTLLVTVEQNAAQCESPGLGTRGAQELVVSRWGAQARIPLPFSMLGTTDREVRGTGCTMD